MLPQQTPEAFIREIRRQRFDKRWIAPQTEVDRSDHTAVDRAGTVVFCLPAPASSSAIRHRFARVCVARTGREEQSLRYDWRNDGIGERQHAHNRRAV